MAVNPRGAYSSDWTALSLGTYLIGLNRATQVTTELLRITDNTKEFRTHGDPPGIGFAATYLFAPRNSMLRVGPFASFDILRQTVNHDFAGGQFLGTTTHWFATAGLKAGAVVQPDLFIYGLTRATWLNENLNVNFATASSSNVTIPGVTLGLGAEYPAFVVAGRRPSGHAVRAVPAHLVEHGELRRAGIVAPASTTRSGVKTTRSSSALISISRRLRLHRRPIRSKRSSQNRHHQEWGSSCCSDNLEDQISKSLC